MPLCVSLLSFVGNERSAAITYWHLTSSKVLSVPIVGLYEVQACGFSKSLKDVHSPNLTQNLSLSMIYSDRLYMSSLNVYHDAYSMDA